ncbi:hypothetical protein EDB89DRAFT_2023526 [Lactarius sanguifluus]|nr:hypothetical protein EDB89DRAFT_2023526 [Lactarius sanguifluus]
MHLSTLVGSPIFVLETHQSVAPSMTYFFLFPLQLCRTAVPARRVLFLLRTGAVILPFLPLAPIDPERVEL